MQIKRYFTTKDSGAYGETQFSETSSEIRNPDGSLVFEQTSIEVPASWSQVASDILAQKYFRKAGVPAKVTKVEEEELALKEGRLVNEEGQLKKKLSVQEEIFKLEGGELYLHRHELKKEEQSIKKKKIER